MKGARDGDNSTPSASGDMHNRHTGEHNGGLGAKKRPWAVVSSGWNGETQCVTRLSVADFGRDRGQIGDRFGWHALADRLGTHRPKEKRAVEN